MTAASTRRIIAAGAIGNVLEWYDFAVYGYFAAAIGRTFFPSEDKVAQVLAAFGIFAVGFLMRPVGGAVIGYIGDRLGRRTALTFSVAAMAIPTFLVGVLPGYQTLGLAAPILLTLLRMIQGLSVGGEYTTSIVFMVEHAKPGGRGLIGAMGCCGAVGGILAGSATGAVLASVMSEAVLESWGWRIPFMLGLVVGLAGFFLRRGIHEETKVKTAVAASFLATVRNHRSLLLRLAALSVFNSVGFYLMFVYIVSWLQLVDGIAPARALGINTVSMALLLPLMLATAWLSDRIGRRPVLMAATAFAFVAAWPLFWMMHNPDPALVLLGQLGFVLSVGAFVGCQPALMVETVPTEVRCTVIALGYNVTLGVIGGLSPLVATWLVDRTGNDYSPAFMIMAAAATSFLALLSFRESYRVSLTPA
ncbi:MFS transporter [Reyranella soli]|jgi:MHS family proline/betaine transporter-like MFS transporter|uniref:Proline/betaine transporter n=1 Tax=Reyranella soli TaxID=1230389 RepID=A0A512NHL1_9HYPH|nr:MFS transporter [Reyranella soli]GEP58448.1 proline/betaine transporter [Reyranella soli]